MKIGLLSPVVRCPTEDSALRDAGISDLVRITQAADECGISYTTCAEHVALPHSALARRGSRFFDPLATFGYLAALTTKLRFMTNVLVLGYHHPMTIAKQYGTFDAISGGRLILGVGLGTLTEEFDLLGVPYADRGARADDAIRALRASLSQREPSYHGEYYSYSGMIVDPCAIQDHVPIWVGGETVRSLRRAVALGDGWCPYGLSIDQLKSMISKVDIPVGFDLIFMPQEFFDPMGSFGQVEDLIGQYAELGATALTIKFTADTPDEYVEQIRALSSGLKLGE